MYQGRRVLPESLISEMLSDQVGSKPIIFTPRDAALHYGLGVWRDRVGPTGEPAVGPLTLIRGLVREHLLRECSASARIS